MMMCNCTLKGTGRRLGSAVVLLLLATAAAAQPGGDVIVDQRGVNAQVYAVDLADCRAYAEQVPVVRRVSVGAAGAAAVGGVFGAIFGGPAEGAATGAVFGGAERGFDAHAERRQVLRRCLSGRGYRVLN